MSRANECVVRALSAVFRARSTRHDDDDAIMSVNMLQSMTFHFDIFWRVREEFADARDGCKNLNFPTMKMIIQRGKIRIPIHKR